MDQMEILIVDDQILFAESLKSVLENDAPDMHVVSIAHNGKEAIDLVIEEPPDLILMDVRMPVVNGVQATQAIHEIHPEIKILMLTTFDDDEYVQQAIKYGAAGYLLKDINPAELIMAIRAVMAGTILLSPSIMKKLAETADGTRKSAVNDMNSSPFLLLNRREKDVLHLLIQGYDNRQIADTLILGQQTIKNYISGIYTKLGVHNRVQIMNLAAEYGYKSTPQLPEGG